MAPLLPSSLYQGVYSAAPLLLAVGGRLPGLEAAPLLPLGYEMTLSLMV